MSPPGLSLGKSIQIFQPFLNMVTVDDCLAYLAFVVGTFNPNGSNPVLLLQGPQGSGKSRASNLIKRAIDPTSLEGLPFPEDEADLTILAANQAILCFDNQGLPLIEWVMLPHVS